MRDGRLRELERVREVTHAALFPAGESVDDRDPGRVAECLEDRSELVRRARLQRRRCGATAEGLKEQAGSSLTNINISSTVFIDKCL